MTSIFQILKTWIAAFWSKMTTPSTSDLTLSTVETVVSDLTPGLGSVATIAKLADDGLSLVSQPIKSAQLDKPVNEAKDRTAEYENILAEIDPIKLAADLGAFDLKLCADSGFATGELSGRTRRVPVECLNSHYLGLIAAIEEREKSAVAASLSK